jgi:hypothetical protein
MRHAGYAVSQKKRKLVEEAFAWAKTIAGCAKVNVRGLARVRPTPSGPDPVGPNLKRE